ncbi:MAG: DUF1761 family protein [Marinosulfonomonas sp.]|nr:DUF1761 family protein [Marinosulfonomonas sp.]
MENLNWIAVIIGTGVAFIVGWAWYSGKLFGKGWAAGSGVELGAAKSMPVGAMLAQVIALFLLALVVGVTAQTDALITAILAILAAAAFLVSSGSFAGKSGYALAVDAGYVVVAGVVMIVCQGIF